ncbi:hypothetical protein B0G76_6777 [Paraburkholderia sp. BL23I1N1]|nr:hypothetical protein B0G76_6777 [Paraburkholderia sp. BL23I1N1]
MRHETDTGVARRYVEVHAQMATARCDEGVGLMEVCESSRLSRPAHRESGIMKSFWVVVLVLAALIGSVIAAIVFLDLMARLVTR